METQARARRPITVREDGYCFACGPQNPVGLKLDFKLANGRVETTFMPSREHQGFAGIVHGGLIGLVLDEAMAKLLYLQGIEALTCEITVRLRRVANIGEPLEIRASLLRERKRLLELEAVASDRRGEMVATAQAKFLRVRSGETQAGSSADRRNTVSSPAEGNVTHDDEDRAQVEDSSPTTHGHAARLRREHHH